jgi:penicillin-binding protein 1A
MTETSQPRPLTLADKLKRWSIRALVAIAISILLGAIAVGAVLLYFNNELPDVDDLSEYRPPQVSRLVDRNGVVVAELFQERRTVVPFERIPEHVRLAFLAAEDADFYKHKGLDFSGMLRAFWANLKAGRVVQGGSTITQQVIKTFLLSPERSYSRKIKELMLAFRLESNLSKDEILYLYLNQIYFGHGTYGVQEAARFYFGKDVDALSVAEGAMLASLPKSPARYSPVRHHVRARKRRNWVIGQMRKNEMIDPEKAKLAEDDPLTVSGKSVDFFGLAPYYAEHVRRMLEEELGSERLYTGGFRIELGLDLSMQHYALESVKKGLRAVDRRQGFRGPLGRISAEQIGELKSKQTQGLADTEVWSLRPVESNGDEGLEAARAWRGRLLPLVEGARLVVPVVAVEGQAKQAVATVDLGSRTAQLDRKAIEWARKFSPVKKTPAPRSVRDVLAVGDVVEVEVTRLDSKGLKLRLSQPPLVQSALVAIDPHSRHVLAMIGGSDFRETPLIRAVQSRRQPGSAFKPIVYATAIEAGALTPATIMMDTPEVYRSSLRGRAWKPRNYERVFVGPVSMRHALAHSINTIAVKVASDQGPGKILAMARKLGIESKLNRNLSIALGSSEVTPLELTNAYASFVAGGLAAPPVFVTRITGLDGKEIELPEVESHQAVSPATAFVMTSLLRSVVEDGTGKKALRLGRPVGGKTGTANQQRDGWFVGFSPGLACGVWVGFDDHSRMGSGWAAGSGTALPIWVDFMQQALLDTDRRSFKAPADVIFARVDPDNGLLAPPRMPGSRFEVFVEGSEPRAWSSRQIEGGTLAGSGDPLLAPELGKMPEGMFK